MGKAVSSGRSLGRALAACAALALVAACADSPSEPAPVYMKGAGYPAEAMALPPPAPLPPVRRSAPPPARRIVVRPGQSLAGIAHQYRVPPRAIIEANRLRPPYKVEAGMHLTIPGEGRLEPTPPPTPPGMIAAAPLAPPSPASHMAERSPDVIPLDGPAPFRNGAAAPVRGAPPPPTSEAAAAVAADVAREAGQPHAPAPGTAAAAGKGPAVVFPPENGSAPKTAARGVHGGRFPWPVQGRVLAGYGTVGGGAHNDGINIAASRGAPIRAVEGGVVAYAGNELRGYGNLVLIKHPDGFISAYAHCEELLVKKGESVRPGQVIGRVGATGGVGEPQLHFELRRGKQPVDPREFLGPAPSAGGAHSDAG